MNVRKDRYNKKMEKYRVIVEEAEEDISDFEEQERHVGTQAWHLFNLVRIHSHVPPKRSLS